MPERERDLLDAARDARPRSSPRFSSGNASSPRTVPITTCVSGSWKSVPTSRASAAGPWSRSSMPQISARPSKVPPWKCGTSPLRDPQQRRLARRRGAGENDELALGELERDVAQRGHARARVAVGHAFELERAGHRTIPRRCANGASAASASAPASERRAPPGDTVDRGVEREVHRERRR